MKNAPTVYIYRDCLKFFQPMKKIIIILMLVIPMALSAQNRHLDDLKAGKSVQFEQKNERAYILVAMRKIDDAYGAVVQFDPVPNDKEDLLCICEIKGEEIELYLVDAPIRPAFHLRFEGDGAKFRVHGEDRWIPMYRKALPEGK